MSYEALRPPNDFEGSDVDSIQSSPQLNTESHFAFNQSADSSFYQDRSFETPFEAENDSFREGPVHLSPYNTDSGRSVADFSYTGDETVGRFSHAFSSQPPESAVSSRLTPNSIKRQNRLSKPPTWSENPPVLSAYHPFGESADPRASAMRQDETDLHVSETPQLSDHNPDRSFAAAPVARPSMQHPKLQTLAEERLSMISNNPDALLAPPLLANGKAPSKISVPGSVTSGSGSSHYDSGRASTDTSAPLNGKKTKSSFSAPSFDRAVVNRSSSGTSTLGIGAPAKHKPAVLANKPETSTTAAFAKPRSTEGDDDDDDDDDALPFEATTKAPADRPPSLALPSTIPVMSSQSFENYRKSVSSLKMLQRAARHPKEGSASGSNSDSPEDDGSDSDSDGQSVTSELLKEEREADPGVSSTKEQRRRSALMRQEQDARMSVYRQKMTKIIGSTAPSTIDRRSIVYDDAQSIHRNSGGSSDQDLLDDIPLSILQAHRFPRARSMSPDKRNSMAPTNRPASVMESPMVSSRPLSTASMSMMGQAPRPRPSQTTLSTQSLTPLPPLFGNKDRLTTRGLVGAISREEQKKLHRRTVGYTETTFDEPVVTHNASQHQSRQSPATNSDLVDMQTKLDHVINMLVTMTPGAPGPAVPYAGSVNNLSTDQFIRPIHAPRPAPSMRSVATRIPPMRPPSLYSLPSLARQRTPSIRSARNSIPPQSANGAPNDWNSVMGVQAPSAGTRGVQQLTKGANRPSQMRIVATDDADDDDDEWEQLAKNRQALKEEWSKQELSST